MSMCMLTAAAKRKWPRMCKRIWRSGFRYIRVQMGGYGGKGSPMVKPKNAPAGAYFDPRDYCRKMLDMIAYVREQVGDEVELLHDIHERLTPIHAVEFAKDVEQFKLFLPRRRACAGRYPLVSHDAWAMRHTAGDGRVCSIIRMNGNCLIQERLIDFIRMHISQMGGITPARNVAIFADMYGIRTAWHGPERYLAGGPRRQLAA